MMERWSERDGVRVRGVRARGVRARGVKERYNTIGV